MKKQGFQLNIKLYYSEKETALYVQQYGLEMVRCKMHKKGSFINYVKQLEKGGCKNLDCKMIINACSRM